MDLAEALAWYSLLAAKPGWKEYVWHRVNEMARECPGLYGELPALLTAEMRRRGSEQA